jgi:hypothetical protein
MGQARASALGHGRTPAERYLALAMQAASARGSRHEIAVTELCHAEIALARTNRVHAAAILDQAGAAFGAMDMGWHLAQVERLRGSL